MGESHWEWSILDVDRLYSSNLSKAKYHKLNQQPEPSNGMTKVQGNIQTFAPSHVYINGLEYLAFSETANMTLEDVKRSMESGKLRGYRHVREKEIKDLFNNYYNVKIDDGKHCYFFGSTKFHSDFGAGFCAGKPGDETCLSYSVYKRHKGKYGVLMILTKEKDNSGEVFTTRYHPSKGFKSVDADKATFHLLIKDGNINDNNQLPVNDSFGGWGLEGRYNNLYDTHNVARGKDTIKKIIDIVPIKGMTTGIGIVFEGKNSIAHIGPKKYFGDDIGLKPGDKVKFTYSLNYIDNEEILMIQSIRSDRILITTRNFMDGKPVWLMSPEEMNRLIRKRHWIKP